MKSGLTGKPHQMTEQIEGYLRKLMEEQTLCAWMQYFSCLTWERITFCRSRARIKIYETTITQDLVFQLRLLSAKSALPIYVFETIDEKSNGNDLEIFIETKFGYLLLAVQAKVIYNTNSYPAIHHKVGNNQQIDLLMKYADENDALPLYLLYNGQTMTDAKGNPLSDISFKDVEQYGCSFVRANTIKNLFEVVDGDRVIRRVPKFKILHPFCALPFHKIICEVANLEVRELKKRFDLGKNVKLKFHRLRQILADRKWINLTPTGMAKIGFIKSEPQKQIDNSLKNFIEETHEGKFNPRFRIVLSNTHFNQGSDIYILS